MLADRRQPKPSQGSITAPSRTIRQGAHRRHSLIAAAEVLSSPNQALRKGALKPPAQWQSDAWEFYDTIGELRFGMNWIGNAMSRVNLAAAAPPSAPGDEPQIINPAELDDDERPLWSPLQIRSAELMAEFAGGPGGQGQILGAFGLHLSCTGVGWLVAEPNLDDRYESWIVYSSDQLRTNRSDESKIEVQDQEAMWRPLHPDHLLIKAWRSHPRFTWQPDSPVRGVLPVLKQISLLHEHINATAESRLAGAGIIWMPDEITLPSLAGLSASPVAPDQEADEEDFTALLVRVMTVPIADRGTAAAHVPLAVQVPAEALKDIQHMTFSTPFDDKVESLLNLAIRRLALGIDLPPEVLLGLANVNHWSAWQVEETAITLHIEPIAEIVCHAITLGYLRLALESEGFDPAVIEREVMTWYDATDLKTRPDRSKSATEAFDRLQIDADTYLRENGLSPDDRPDGERMKEQALLMVGRENPSLMPTILSVLGFIDDAELARITEVQGIVGESGQDDARSDREPNALPERPDPPDDADRASQRTVILAADQIVYRALERAGQRLRSAAGRNIPGGAASIQCQDPTRLHIEVSATGHADLDHLLLNAWNRVPELAEEVGVDPDALERTLDSYTRALLASGQEHSVDRLSAAFGV